MSEQEFAEMASKQAPSMRGSKVDLSTVVQRLRSNNVEKVITAPAEKAKAQEQTKLDKKTIDVQSKLISNVEKLTKAISESTKFASFRANIKSDERLGAKGRYAAGGRGEELADKQTIDYRTIGQRIQDKVIGRGQNQFDPNSLKYKFGSVRGLLDTTGLVKRGSGGILDSAVAQREERKFGAATLKKLYPKSKANFENKIGKAQGVKNTLQREQDRVEALRSSGMSDFEIQSTPGGSDQLKSGQFYKRNLAAAKLVDIDPRYKGEKARDLEGNTNVKFAGPDDDKLNVSQEEDSQLKAVENISKPTEELINITKVENERREKADKELLDAVKGIESKGGVLGGMMSSLSGMGGGLPKAGGYLSKVGGLGKLAKGVGIGAIAGLAGEGLQMGGDKLKEAGYENTGKAVGVAGTATKYAGYGAMIGSVVPGVGTAIGAGLGGVIGAGKGVYDQYFSDDSKPKTISSSGETMSYKEKDNYSMRYDPATGKYSVNGKEVSEKDYQNIQNSDGDQHIKAIKTAINNADQVAAQSSDNAIAKTASNSQPSNTIVNAPTNVSKQTQNTAMHVPVRDQDHSIRSYYRSRFAS
jgi:hypothetical protein